MSRRSQSHVLHALLLTMGVAVSACSGGGGSSFPPARAATPSATSTTLTLSASTVSVGVSVTLTAAVTSSGAAVTSGSVSFLDGTTQLGTVALDENGKAAWSSSTIGAGTHSLSASYTGTSAFAASTSSAASLAVTGAGVQSALALAVSPSITVQGLPVEIVATVTGGGSTQVPTGTVTFTAGAAALGSAALDPSGVANFTSTLLAGGAEQITAAYTGDATFAPAASSGTTVTVNAMPAATYMNPLTLHVTDSQLAVSCADPAIYKAQNAGTNTWYLYCTSDALFAGDTQTHYINIFHSTDLVNWTHDGDAFAGMPSWANVNGGMLWAPAIKFFNGQYYLYYAVPVTSLPGGGSAIGVGTSASPAGPFVHAGSPVVEPETATNCCNGGYRATLDPDVIEDGSGQKYILFGSFAGGLYVRKLSADGLSSDKASEVEVAADSRYEGGNWWQHDGYYYLFASSGNCCNGPLSGYGVFVGRSSSPMGPYLDAQGIAMTAVTPGGTQVMAMNGNRVIGPGGNVIFTDEAGQDYILYHGILAGSPYYAGAVGYTARPGFIDAIDWVNGWPVARGGFGASDADAPQPTPAAQPGGLSGYVSTLWKPDAARGRVIAASDDFDQSALGPQWSFLHGTPSYTVGSEGYQVQSVAADPVANMTAVPLLSEPAPSGDYIVETKLDINLPVSGKGSDFAQAGLLIYGSDQDFVRLDAYNNNDTRQVEFVKAEKAEQSGFPTWGSTNVGPAAINMGVTVWLRIVKRNVNGESHYTAYSSNDGVTWIPGATWVHALGKAEKICLYAGNQAGFTGTFHYVHVSTLE